MLVILSTAFAKIKKELPSSTLIEIRSPKTARNDLMERSKATERASKRTLSWDNNQIIQLDIKGQVFICPSLSAVFHCSDSGQPRLVCDVQPLEQHLYTSFRTTLGESYPGKMLLTGPSARGVMSAPEQRQQLDINMEEAEMAAVL